MNTLMWLEKIPEFNSLKQCGIDAFLQISQSKFRWHNTLQHTRTVHREYFNSVCPRDYDFRGRRESIIYGKDKLECALCMEISCKIFLKKGVTVTPAEIYSGVRLS